MHTFSGIKTAIIDIATSYLALTAFTSVRLYLQNCKSESVLIVSILQKMRLVSENLEMIVNYVLASCNNSKWHPALRYYCPNVSQLVCTVLLGVPIVVSWLVLVGVNGCILIKVLVRSGKTNLSLFCGHFL